MFQALLHQFPLLENAHTVIRTSRSVTYFEQGDRFGRAWAQTLAVPEDLEVLAGTNMSALDRVFEDVTSVEAAETLFSDLQRLTLPAAARDYLNAAKNEVLSLRQAVEVHVAFLTWRGYQSLTAIETDLAEDWLQLWQHKIRVQNSQQTAHSTASLNAHTYKPTPAPFDAAVENYLDQFGETGALAVAVIGALPFSPLASSDLLAGVAAQLRYLAPLFRFAQDVQFEIEEQLNAGIYAVAAEQGTSIQAARTQIRSGEIPERELHRRLALCWTSYLPHVQALVADNLSGYATHPLGEPLGNLSKVLLSLAQRLVHPWKA